MDQVPRYSGSKARAGPQEYIRAQLWRNPVSWISVAPRRLRDLNLPGAWAWVFLAPFVVLPIAPLLERVAGTSIVILMLISTLPAALLNLVLMFVPGTKGPNRYGEEPVVTRRRPTYVPPPPPPPSTDDKLAGTQREIDDAKRRLTPDH